MPRIIRTKKELLSHRKKLNGDIGFVPTMGNLHLGHLSLVDRSERENDHTVVSIFVNPTQFAANEDLENYPSTLEADVKLIQAIEKKQDIIIFAPLDSHEVYGGLVQEVEVDAFEKELEGSLRRTHFKGVLTVVKTLFELVTPDRAYFGKKDFQQYIIIRNMVRRLSLALQVIAGEIIRTSEGLALSSRNSYLSDKQIKEALILQTTLQELRHIAEAEGYIKAQEKLNQILKEDKNFKYLEFRDPESFLPLNEKSKRFVLLGNYKLDKTHLLDNLEGSL